MDNCSRDLFLGSSMVAIFLKRTCSKISIFLHPNVKDAVNGALITEREQSPFLPVSQRIIKSGQIDSKLGRLLFF